MGQNLEIRILERIRLEIAQNLEFRILESYDLEMGKILISGFWKVKILKPTKV